MSAWDAPASQQFLPKQRSCPSTPLRSSIIPKAETIQGPDTALEVLIQTIPRCEQRYQNPGRSLFFFDPQAQRIEDRRHTGLAQIVAKSTAHDVESLK